MTKRIICILMMLVLVAQGCFAQDVFFESAETEEYIPLSGASFEVGGIAELEDEEPISFFNASSLPFDEYIAGFVLNHDELPEKITGLEQYGISLDEYEGEFFKMYTDAVMKHPETLLHTALNGCFYNSDRIITAVKPVYLVANRAEAESARLQMESAVNAYINLANEYYDSTSEQKYVNPLQKLLVIHDKMVANCDYDVRVLSEDSAVIASVDKTVYHAFGALCNKKAVCQGYSQALYMIGKRLGIEMDFCRSKEKKHMWNYVKLDGKWYHMDMTNDDPPTRDADENIIPREDPRAWHRFFMVSDSGLTPEAHGTDFATMTGEKYTCDDKRYESNYLFNMNRIFFTAEKDSKGYYNAVLENISGPLGTDIAIPFKSKTLYTGPVVEYPFKTLAPVEVMENGEEVTKILPCLYLAHYTTRNLPRIRPFVKTKDWIRAYPARDTFTKDSCYIVGIARDVENNPLGEFISFLFDAETLRPYTSKKKWTFQQN